MHIISPECLFVTDLHGSASRYKALFKVIEGRRPKFVFIGGDILPSGFRCLTDFHSSNAEFLTLFVANNLAALRERLSDAYPRVFVILGNDDGNSEEPTVTEIANKGLWEYVNQQCIEFADYKLLGYSFVPPTPFRLKDWEKYDVSRYVDPGCVSPEEGIHSLTVSAEELRYSTIQRDLVTLTAGHDLSRAIFLFHTPPYQSNLDMIDNDGVMIEGVPLDPHIGSIAVRRLIESGQPLLTLHGHAHESTRLSGSWKDVIGKTHMFSAAYDGPELAVVSFDLEHLENATRELVVPD